jgi:hypothetical protein
MSKDDHNTPANDHERRSTPSTDGAAYAGPSEHKTEGELNINQPESVPPGKVERWKRQLQSWVPIITVIVSLVALLVIITQAVIYNQQRQVMNSQREVMHDQVQLTEKSLRVSERAYVGVASLTANLAQGEILITLENLGKVPANNISVQADAYWANWATRNLEPFPHEDFDAGEVKLFPGSLKMRVVVPMRKFNTEEISAMRDSKNGSLFVVGIIQYEDGFGYADITKFNFKYTPPPNDNWIAVKTPVASMKEDLVSRMNGLPPIEIWKPISASVSEIRGNSIRATSPLTSNVGTPIGAPTAETRHRVATQTSGGSCACSCSYICAENRCEFSCMECSLSQEVTAAAACCEQVRNALGCPKQ